MISDKLKSTILRELSLGDYDLRDDTMAYQVPGWDSLRHVAILAAVEREFGVRFRSLEVIRLRNVGDLQALVDRKSSASKKIPRLSGGMDAYPRRASPREPPHAKMKRAGSERPRLPVSCV